MKLSYKLMAAGYGGAAFIVGYNASWWVSAIMASVALLFVGFVLLMEGK